jgi:hypothetical protein
LTVTSIQSTADFSRLQNPLSNRQGWQDLTTESPGLEPDALSLSYLVEGQSLRAPIRDRNFGTEIGTCIRRRGRLKDARCQGNNARSRVRAHSQIQENPVVKA